jgi:phage/plasmid primase-like uncharacterized protein
MSDLGFTFNGADYLDVGHYLAPADPSEAFRAAMMEKLGHAPRRIDGDGRVHRFATSKSGHDDAGWYRLYADDFPAGSFGDWRTGEKFSWRAREVHQMSTGERQRLEEVNVEREKADEIERAKSVAAAKARWENAALAGPDHPYLQAKSIGPHGVRLEQGCLLVPVLFAGEIVSVQAISGTGEKRFAKGTRVDGGYYSIGELGDKFVIAEGFATCATIREATGLPVVAAFTAGNILPVAKLMRERFPNATIIVGGDDDFKTEMERGFNPGLLAANKAAETVGAIVATPPFDREQDGDDLSDWNDYAASHGNDAVRDAFQAAHASVHVEEETEAECDEESDDESCVIPNGKSKPFGFGVKLEDFFAYMPMHNYIFAPNRGMWPGISVDSKIGPIPLFKKNGKPVVDGEGKQKKLRASAWLDRHHSVEQMTWVPGAPMLIRDRLMADGGWIERKGVTSFNLYMPPTQKHGDAAKAGNWIDHVHRVFGDDAEHIIQWLAHRVQRPWEKINHALVIGGHQGSGKDTMLEPVMHAVGPWNFQEVRPEQVMGRFNGFLKSVILRISEARDLGDLDRFKFYDHMKTYTAAPPDVLRVDEKHLREHAIVNCCGVIITTNYKTNGIYLPADDRRHFVAWSDVRREDLGDSYFDDLYGWYASGGIEHTAAYLATLDISGFNPKAPPPKTQAFWDIVDTGRATEDSELADVIDGMGAPDAFTIAQITARAEADGDDSLSVWLKDRKNRRVIPHRLETCGYVPVRNAAANDGLWVVGGKRQAVYGKKDHSQRDRLAAASALVNRRGWDR